MTNLESTTRAAIHSIDHFALNVPSLEVAQEFFRSFGLNVSLHANELELRTFSETHCWARVIKAKAKSLAYVSFNCYEYDLATIKSQVLNAGVSLELGIPLNKRNGFWFYDPDGNLIQVQSGPKTMPSKKSHYEFSSTQPNKRGAPTRSKLPTTHPLRLSHILLFSPDVLRAVEFYHRTLGIKLSDRSGDQIAFMHGAHGSDHHLIGFVKSQAKGWHHSAWDVPGVDEVGQGSAQMVRSGYVHGWGTGRHVLGSNYFYYVQDPWGSFCEYSADIDFISADHLWPAGDFEQHDSLYLWGPDLPSYFLKNTEI
jgi:catechol 2,3-dioxygenase-like lactoylglutathione lyase family enzyme